MNQFGYMDSRLGEDLFQIGFVGKQNDPVMEARDAALLRSAEAIVSHGFNYFVLINEQVSSIDSAFTIGTIHNMGRGTARD